MKKRVLALLLAVATALTALPLEAFAYGGTSGSSYPSGTIQVSDNGTDGYGGYRISVQFVDVNTISGYGDIYTSGDSFEGASTDALQKKYSKCLPSGDNKALYFFNFTKQTTYVMLGTSFSQEYDVTKEERCTFSDSSSSTLGSDDVIDKWIYDKRDTLDYSEVESYADKYVASSDKVSAYLKYIEYLCTSDKSTVNKETIGYMNSSAVQDFFYPSGASKQQKANEVTLFHMLVISKLTGIGTSEIETYNSNVNAGKKITKIPIILIESMASFKDNSGNRHCWTLAQWIAKVKTLNEDEAIKALYTPTAMGSYSHCDGTEEYRSSFTYLLDFLNPLTSKVSGNNSIDSSKKGTIAWASYGLIAQPGDSGHVYGLCNQKNIIWRRSTSGFSQKVMSSNESSIMKKKFGAYPGYSFYWMTNPVDTTKSAEYNAKIKAVWCDAKESDNPDNGSIKITRTTKPYTVGIEAHYAVYGSDNTNSYMTEWLSSNKGKSYKYTLEISIYNSPLTTNNNPKMSVDPGTFHTGGTNCVSFKDTFGKTLPSNISSNNGYKNDTLTYKDIINFLNGDACIYFYSDRYKEVSKKSPDTFSAQAYARVSIYPTGYKDKDKEYPWSSDDVQTNTATLRYTVETTTKDGKYNVQADEEFANKVFDSGDHYTYDKDADDWQTIMYVEDLGDFVSNTDGLNESNVGMVAINLTASAKHPMFYNSKLAGVAGPSGVGLSAAKALYTVKNPKTAEEKVIAELEKEMVALYNASLTRSGIEQSSSNPIRLTGPMVLALRRMIIDKTRWGITGYVKKGTWQNIEATLNMSFGISITWVKDGKTRNYELTPINDSVVKVYPCHPTAVTKFAQNKYHVDATPDAKIISITDSTTYDLGANGESGDITTAFTIGDLAKYKSIIKQVKSAKTADIQVVVTRADGDGSSGIFMSRGDKLQFANASTFGLRRKQNNGNVWVWDKSTPIYKVLEAFMSADAQFEMKDSLEAGRYILSTSNPQIMFCYKIEIVMNIGDITIIWSPDPGRDTVSWLANVDLYYNSAIDANFAEIKEGSPTNETYEAMSGVPVTANLYYATGGHEFVVNTSYQIQKFSPYREYHYDAPESACDESWIQTGDSSLACIQIGACDGHTYFWSGTSESGSCVLNCTKTTDSVECSESCPNGCPGGHTVLHTHTQSCYNHTYVNATATDNHKENCTVSGWTKTRYWTESASCACGAGYQKLCSEEVTCLGQGTGSYTTFKSVSDDCQSAAQVSHSWKHCKCHCPASTHWECNPDLKHYKETWTTTLSDIYYTVITQAYVWRIAGNYLTTNQDLLEADDVIYSEWLPTEDSTSSPGYVYFWSADKSHLTNTTGNVLGRIHYYWHDGSHKLDGSSPVDDISLNATQGGSGFAGDIGKTCSTTLYTDDDCDRAETGGRLGWTYDKLYECYLKHIKDDGGAGQRFGVDVVSDFLFYSANNDDIQAVYYHDYGIYAGADKSRSNTAGTPLHDVAQFNKSEAKGDTHTVSGSTVSATTCYKVTIDKDGKDTEILEDDYNNSSSGFLWEKNSTSVGYKVGGKPYIDTDDLARAGYNGLADTSKIEEKYTPTNTQNFTYDSNRAVMKYWDDYYAEGFLRHKYKSSNSTVAAYDSGQYLHFAPKDESTGLTAAPKKQPLPLYLGVKDLEINDIAENGLYESGKVENFYQILIKYDPNNRGSLYKTGLVSWANNCSAVDDPYGFSVPTTYYYGDGELDNRYINEVIVYVPSAADLGIGVSTGSSPFIDDRVSGSKKGVTAINLEADGTINFPLISNIQEIPDNPNSLSTCTGDIGKGYGGYGQALNVIEDPHYGLQWVDRKWITVSNYVIVDTDGDGSFTDERVYAPYDEIELSIFDANHNYIEDYAFYLPEMAFEDSATTITYYTSTINNTSSEDTTLWEPNNVDEKYNSLRDYYRYHGAMNTRIFQAVGRIGNLTMVDTGDFRYSNFFKASTDEWLVPNVVYQVDDSSQVRVVIDEYDIFDRKGGGATAWNTYGSQDHKENLSNAEPASSYDIISSNGTRRTHYYALPLLPKYNNIEAFKDTPMRVGYAAYLDVETIGNYYNGTAYVTVQYSYYGMDKNNNLHPLDVYMLKDGEYVLINDFYNDNSKITSYPVYMKWDDENARRMYTATEDERTQAVNEHMEGSYAYDMFTGTRDKVYPYYPSGNMTYQGNYNSSILGFDSRTFIGDYYYNDVIPGFPDNNNTNVGGYISDWQYYRNSQKWYFSNELPSSAVFVESGSACTKENIDLATSKYDKAVVTAIITAHGDVWDLCHDGSNSWAKLKETYPPTDPTEPDYPLDNPPTPTPPTGDEPTPPTPPTPPTVITIIPIPETSRDDVTTIGTH